MTPLGLKRAEPERKETALRRMPAVLALAATFVLGGCSSAAPTPQIIYVTPLPSVTPSPVASVSSTPTGDDAKIIALITDTEARLSALGGKMSSGGSVAAKIAVLPELRDLLAGARQQQNFYRPSPCFSTVTDFFRSGLDSTYDGVTQALNAWNSGGDAPDIRRVIDEGAAGLRGAFTLAQSTKCP